VFGVKVLIHEKLAGIGAGKNKKEAEQRAAQKTLQRLPGFLKKIHG
jgi:dsRNA-specific ribonuclease